MIDIRFRGCCEMCPYIDVVSETTKKVTGEVETVIGCHHSCVCAVYRAEVQETPSQDITVRGFHDADG